MHRSRSRRTAVVSLAVLALASLGAGPGPRTSPSPDPAALARFYGQHIRWGDCPDQPGAPAALRCGTLTVPLDHADPAKGTLSIAMAKIPANGRKRLGSLLLNFGGPGGPGVEALAADPKAFADLGESYDLVAFDPRGVGHSAPVSCGGVLDAAPGDDSATGEDPGTGDDPAAQLAALRAVAERCAEHSGPVLPYIGTVHVARDLDVMRQALGDDKLNYLGFSYGTRLGAVYAAQFPRRVGRMVLDGVDTLTEPLVEQALVSAQGQQQALENFLRWCTRRQGCVYGTNTRTAKEKVNALVTRLDTQPLIGEDGSPFTGQDATRAIAGALYSQDSWPSLAEGLAAAERDGDPTGLLQLGGPTGPPPPEANPAPAAHPVPADNMEAALIAVNCADDPDRGDAKASPAAIEKEIDARAAEFRAASPVFGPHQLMTVLSCYGRPAGSGFLRAIDRPGAPRMLLVGTRGDPATPYRWTEETAARLGSAVVLDYKGDGHAAYFHSVCVRERVNAFLVEGELASGTMSCPAGDS
ncbi:alpha/beta hydrolase [Streptomyces sp. NBC_00536]|uniref:alpha/beta hydrolase n=1 Tax=Streptomyces sp. NBC_00536 TaxID=2975769 RepID=UPI002E81024D|nr:alpha/beta hydrolase [Streptomyces sp. NBC_00536]WUC79664.1 alpha/beta hydrolase [Streptomyces sp. NBC_00536]